MSQYKCPYCPSRETNVTDSRSKANTPYTRYRKCPKCGKSFKTVEVHLDTDSEDYLNLVSRMSTEKLMGRFTKVLSSRSVQNAFNAQLRKLAGIRKGKITSPSDMFE